MALVAVKAGKTARQWCTLSFLALLLNLAGGDASPLSSEFRVYGLDTVRAGVEAFLSCFLEGSDTGSVTRPPSYVWVKDGKVIPGQTDMTLKLKAVTREDAGFYQCGAPGSDVGGQGRHLNVVVPGDILPKPTVDYRGHPVCGRPFALRCIFMERYIPSANTMYTWYKDYAQVRGQTGQTLTFPNMTEADAGEYVCTGREGGVETTSPPSQEYHMLPLVIPHVTMETASKDSVAKGILGQNLTLTAKVIQALPQVPRDGFSWSFFPFPQGQQRPLAEKTCTLTLGPLTLEDRGQYVCQARNDQANTELQLIGLASVTLDVVYSKNITLTPDLEVKEGDPVTLTCAVDSHPTARLVWIVNGQEVRHVTYNVDHYVIPSAACSDSNNYTCAASNTELPVVELSATTQLTVLCRQDTLEPFSKEANPTSMDTATRVTPTVDESGVLLWKTFAIILTGLLGAILAAVVVLVLYWRRLTYEKRRRRIQKLLHFLLHFLLPAQIPRLLEEDESQQFLDLDTAVDTKNVTDEKTPVSGSSSHQPKDDQGAVQGSTARDGTGLRKRSGNRERAANKVDPGGKIRSSPSLQKLMSAMRGKVPTPQGQKVNFDAAYQKGAVHVLPSLPDSKTQQPAGAEGVPALGREEDSEKLESKAIVIRLLHQLLSETVRPDDPPVFLFTQSLPANMDAIIYHQVYGAIAVKVKSLESVNVSGSSPLQQAGKELLYAKRKLLEELQEQLQPDGVTLLLTLPNMEVKGKLGEQNMDWLQNKKIQVVVGKIKADYLTWLQKLPTSKQPALWGLGADSNLAFKTAVSRYLSVLSYGAANDPPSWLLTSEQASVLHCRDKLVHVWGPPGSGKSLLLLDRVRRWLLRGKTVVLAVCSPHYKLLLHRLGRAAVNHLPKDIASRLTLCSNVKDVSKAIPSSDTTNPPSHICVAMDAIEADSHSALLDVCRSSTVECVWTTSRADFPNLEDFQKLGGRSVRLSYSLRCTAGTLELARKLLPSEAKVATWMELPGTPASPPSAISVEHHTFHPGSEAGASLKLDCSDCDAWLKRSMFPQEEHLTMHDEQWNRWVVLLTGDWGPDSKQLTEKLVGWLARQGVPAVHEWKPDSQVSSVVSKLHVSGKNARTRTRVEASVDKAKCPAVHVMRGSLFRGLEKPCILVVHYDWRDDHQSREQRDARQSQHQRQLFQAVTSCRETPALLLLSPSPAASLLPHTNG